MALVLGHASVLAGIYVMLLDARQKTRQENKKDVHGRN
jgi:hypothetical protein